MLTIHSWKWQTKRNMTSGLLALRHKSWFISFSNIWFNITKIILYRGNNQCKFSPSACDRKPTTRWTTLQSIFFGHMNNIFQRLWQQYRKAFIVIQRYVCHLCPLFYLGDLMNELKRVGTTRKLHTIKLFIQNLMWANNLLIFFFTSSLSFTSQEHFHRTKMTILISSNGMCTSTVSYS